jgi:aspartyl-tRNA(Asn)/glutamyl-tRNA(Gln) amidotransferase subunit A
MSIWELTAVKIADRVRSAEMSAKEVLETFLARIEAFDTELKSFVFLDPDAARAQAAEIDRRVAAGEDPGPLAGVPLGVKDLEDARGLPTTHGSLLYKENVAEGDSVQVARLRAAGCVVVGKTAAPEFGAAAYTSTPLHGTTRNPWDLERTPGGSSGGSATAVGAALVPIATGSDGGGSIRIPASYSGLFGFKGTFGRVPRGAAPESSYTSVHGPMARDVRDAARYIDCVVGPHEADQFSLPHPGFSYEERLDEATPGLRATWSEDLGFGVCVSEVSVIVKEAAEALAGSEAFEWKDRRVSLKDPAVAWGVLGAAETFHKVESHWEERRDDLTPIFAYGIARGLERIDLPEMTRAAERRWENNQILAGVFEEVDLIVTPTTPTTAFVAEGPMVSEIEGRTIKPMHSICFTYPFNLSGHPAVSLPCGFDTEGLPVGLQIVGRRHSDHLLLALAARFQEIRGWPPTAKPYARDA